MGRKELFKQVSMPWNTLSIKEETQNNPQKTIKSTSPDSEGQKMAGDWGRIELSLRLSHVLLSVRPSLLPSILTDTESGGLKWVFSHSYLHNQFLEIDTHQNFPLMDNLGIHILFVTALNTLKLQDQLKKYQNLKRMRK